MGRFQPWASTVLKQRTPLLLGGDLNIAHTEQDIFYARGNQKNSGFLPHERERGPLQRRARHVVTENERVQRGAELLRAGKLDAFGHLVNASHASLRDDYEVSSAELDHLAATAQATDGVFGARMTGAGFGGCVIALAAPDAVSDLRRNVVQSYVEAFGREPAVYAIERGEEAETFAPEALAENT